MAEVSADLLRGWGFRTDIHEVEPGRPNVVATLDGAGPTLLFNGHLDTVGVDGMTIDPFGAEVKDGKLYGRGSCDMKGGVASLMAASARLAGEGPRPNLVVALTADEEHASVGMAGLVDRLASDRLPDMAVVCEPTGLAVMPAHKGFVWIRATFSGRAAHGSRPEVGVDAIRHAALYLSALEAYAEALRSRPSHALLGHGSFHAGTIRGGTAESVYPEGCELTLERRTLPDEHTDEVLRDFEAVLNDLREVEPSLSASLHMYLDRPGTEVAEASPLVQGLLEASSATGVTPAVRGMTAWVDAAFLNEAGVPAVCYGPGSIDQAHTDDEWCDVDEIRRCADVLEAFARDLAE